MTEIVAAPASSSSSAAAAAAGRREALRGHLAMLAFAAIISGSFSLGGLAAPFIEPAALNALRFFIAALVLGGFALAGPGLRRSQLTAPWRYLALGFALSLYFVLMFEALRLTDPVSTSAVFTLTPAMAALFGWLLLRQGATPRMALALAIGGAGAIWVIFRADLAALLALDIGMGEALFVIGCAGHAFYTPLVRLLKRDEPLIAFSFWTTMGGFLLILAYALANGSLLATDWGALPGVVWVAVLYLAVMATAGTFFLLQFAALRLPASKVMAYGYLVPSFVILWEGLSGRGWAAPLVLVGVAATTLAMLMLLRD